MEITFIILAFVVLLVSYLAIGFMFMQAAKLARFAGALMASLINNIFSEISGTPEIPIKYNPSGHFRENMYLLFLWPLEFIRPKK